MLHVPFRIPSLYADLAEAEGIVSIERDALSLEIQTKDAIVGIIKSSVREINIPFSELREVLFESRWFSSQLIVRGRKMSVLSKIPGCERGELILKISKKHKVAAQNFVVEIGLKIQEANLKNIELNDTE